MLIDLNWWECNKILRLLMDSHDRGMTYSGDDELQAKIESHRRSIEADRLWRRDDTMYAGQEFLVSP